MKITRNIIYLIFSLLFSIAFNNSTQKELNDRAISSDFVVFENYLHQFESLDISDLEKSDTTYYLVLPPKCITCTPWFDQIPLKTKKQTVLITSHPKRYFEGYHKVYEDKESNFLDLSFIDFSIILITKLSKEQKLITQKIERLNDLTYGVMDKQQSSHKE